MKNLGGFLFVIWFISACQPEESKDNIDLEITQLDSIVSEAKPSIGELSLLEKQLIEQGLVNITDFAPTIIIDLKYSTNDNFFGSDVYGNFDKAFLQKEVAESLASVQSNLKEQNPDYSLYIFDAVRPLRIQKILWEALDSIPPATRKAYVADPAEGSIHNYGCAVDLSIYDKKADSLLDMGTNYDYFGALAYPRREDEMLAKGMLTQAQINNRLLLRNLMNSAGFMPITSEWWHFNRYSRNTAKNLYSIVE